MPSINTKRVWLGALAGWVVWAIWSIVTNFGVLMGKYAAAQQAGQMRGEPRYGFFVVAWFVVLFVLSLVAAWLYASVRTTRGAGPKTALTVGVLVGFLAGFPINFSLAAWATFPRVIPLFWMLELWVGAILATFVAGWLYRD